MIILDPKKTFFNHDEHAKLHLMGFTRSADSLNWWILYFHRIGGHEKLVKLLKKERRRRRKMFKNIKLNGISYNKIEIDGFKNLPGYNEK